MDDQTLLSFDDEPVVEAVTIRAKFEEFHDRNPHVYEALVSLAYQAKSRGRDRIGIKQLFEVLRWDYMLRTEADDGFKLNNNYAPHYARLIMDEEPALKDIFETRVMTTP